MSLSVTSLLCLKKKRKYKTEKRKKERKNSYYFTNHPIQRKIDQNDSSMLQIKTQNLQTDIKK